MRGLKLLLISAAFAATTTPSFSRDLSYLKSKPFDQLTSAELSAAKEEAKNLKLTRLVACADPGNLPLSDNKREGFENKIAEAVGRKLGVDIAFFWRPYLERGLTRETFDNHECQVLLGMPTDYPDLLTTVPIYRTTYVLAYRSDKGLDIKSMDDPALHQLNVGVFQQSAMRQVLADHDIKENVDLQIVSADADLEPEKQPWRQVQRVADGKIDIAAVWGPFAGWLKKKGEPLTIQPVNMMVDNVPLEFSLGWGVQNTDVVLKLKIDMAMEDAKDEIAKILEDYGVPLVQCSNCIIEGSLPSHGVIQETQGAAYEDRYLKVQETSKRSAKAAPDQIVSRERLEAWLKEGVDVNTELMNAVVGADAERLKFLIEKGADVNKRDQLGALPLGSAASIRRTDLMEILLDAGAKADAQDSDGMTALRHAINVNHVPSIELLAKRGADIERGTEKGYTALEVALADGKFFAAKALIDAGAKVNVGGGAEKLTPLMVCATQLQPQQRLNQLAHGPTPLVIAEELIKRGADVNSASTDGVTAVMIAAGQNSAPMIGLLLRSGADPKMKSAAGKTALDIATGAGNEAAVGALKFLTGSGTGTPANEVKTTQ
ncbi:quinoprotein dehydrogenase-associated putative ABC transporter substrate-binding protein [Hyphomicrobium sp.]|uniref:quinoprotein dehydrogenase-associated putative ABC transporter substrate-binding protein n=1 Tax=Hyphomicrobium sp. TaxID=82 RepID=UPI001DA9C4E5|nr:quinoprotein dehydrogenase-associated putative ABC transporter substrate-binding protein [Hyphomicrobium sp.]MBY0559607.1 quinoprotein dehydrogenase-associated putative ABC transporter substrate-binding protein [Hyphomicrobium sp.]